jgi:SAM-dependent methyltransferase
MMFEQSAGYYDYFYSFLDYRAAGERLRLLIRERHPTARSLLDVACGTGRHLEHLRQDFDVAGIDILPALIELARRRCPDVPMYVADMTDFHLDRRFDVITCLFCSIGYAVTLERAESAIACMAEHLQPRGLLIVEPWVTPDTCWSNRVTSEVFDSPEMKIVRMHTHEIEGRTSVFDIHYLVGTPTAVKHFVEREVMGLFTTDQYAAAFRKAGLEVEHLDAELFPRHRYGLFVGRRRKVGG